MGSEVKVELFLRLHGDSSPAAVAHRAGSTITFTFVRRKKHSTRRRAETSGDELSHSRVLETFQNQEVKKKEKRVS